ncbi:MAG TPA: oxygenase MpaB family protein [Candidatus Limnocylindria bacterium]|nr:oxygenase MpaB family protein [Candidatus Limnocylindria bacterium]
MIRPSVAVRRTVPRASSGEPDGGLFGPGSLAWRIDREVLVLGGGTCALLLQLAHPAVAAGVAQHSTFRDDPFARLRRTLVATYAVVFGSRSRAERAIARINAIHATVRGAIPESGRAYDARDPRLLLWVHATLIDTAVRIYDRFVTPLDGDDAQAYHAESRQIAVRLGVPESLVPATLVELRAFMAGMVAGGEVAVSPTARLLAPAVRHPTRFPPRFVWDLAHLASDSVMHPEVRRQYGIPWSARREAGVRRIAAASRRLLPAVPAPLRFVPHARSAERRLRRSRPAA